MDIFCFTDDGRKFFGRIVENHEDLQFLAESDGQGLIYLMNVKNGSGKDFMMFTRASDYYFLAF